MADKTIEIEADTLEEARELIKSQIPEDLHLLSEQVISDGKPKTVKAFADTIESAFTRAQGEIPANSVVIEKKEVAAPTHKVMTAEAFDEESARTNLERQIGNTATITTLRLSTAGKKGFLGIGKKPNQYQAEVFQLAVTEIVYKEKAKISATFGEKTFIGGMGERYCSQKCYDAGGATVTKHLLQNWTGDCSVCPSDVALRIGGIASMVCWKPGQFLFHCGSRSCVAAVRNAVRETNVCPICGTGV